MRQAIKTTGTPPAIGSYSPMILAGGVIYLAGQIPLDPISMNLVEGGIRPQVKQVFENIKNLLESAELGVDLENIVKLTVYLMNLSDITVVNEMIAEYFKSPFPARTSIQVAGLPKGALVEIEAVAVMG